MNEKSYRTPCGTIRYRVNGTAEKASPQLVFLPGLTADHRLFAKQIEYFEGKYPLFVWDAPGHHESRPFELAFSLEDKTRWLDGILTEEGFTDPVIVGQSMGGYVGQVYAQLFPGKLKGFVSIDSAPLQRSYMTAAELWLLKRMEPVYRHYPWKTLVRHGTAGVATSSYGRSLMREMMMTYDGDQKQYAALSGHGFRILAEAVEKELPYEIRCPALLICGEKDHAGSCIRYNKAWHKKTGIPIEWIEGAGHNSNTDEPDRINRIIEEFAGKLVLNRPEAESEQSGRRKNMIVLNVMYHCKPGMREAFLEKIKAEGLDAKSRAEAGNLKYDYYFAADNDCDLVLLEKWQDGEALAKHGREPHFARLGEIKTDYVNDTVIEKYEG